MQFRSAEVPNPDHLQIEIYRHMIPAERWRQAVRLWRQARQLAAAGVRARHPEASPAEVQQRVARLFLHGHEC